MGFVTINTNFTLESPDNFWVQNPQMIFFAPYDELYNMDKSKNHSHSSRTMWVINFMQNPDDVENIFYRLPIEDRKEMLSSTFHKKLDWEDPVFKKCYNAFPTHCMSSIKRNLKIASESLGKTTELISETELTLDESIIKMDDRGKEYVLNIKGTAPQIMKLQKDFNIILERFDKLADKYITEKSKTRVQGGGRITKGESSDFW